MAQHIVALDLGQSFARVAVIAATFRHAKLLRVQDVPIEPGTARSDVLAQVRQTLDFPPDSIICALDAKRASVRGLRFPFADQRKIDQAVDFELDGQMPYDLGEVKVVWHVVERTARSTQVLAAITPQAPLEQSLAELAANNLEPRVIMHPSAALAELTPPSDVPGATATVCIGDQQTHVCVLRDGLRAARALHVGADFVDNALAHALEVPLERAREVKRDQQLLLEPEALAKASPEEGRLHRAAALALAPLLTDLLSTFKGVEREDRPTRLVLTGVGSQMPGLPQYLARRCGVQVEGLDLRQALAPLEVGNVALRPEHAVVLALAMAMFRRGQDAPLNFRRGKLAYRGDIQLYRGTLVRVAMGLALVFVTAFAHASVRFALLKSEESQLDRGFCRATAKILGREVCEPGRALALLHQSGTDGGTPIPSYSAAALLEMLARRLPSGVDVHLSELDVRVDGAAGQPERLVGRGEAASFETIEQLTSLLRKDPCVQEAEIARQRKTQNSGRVEFDLKVTVRCPVGQQPGGTSVAQAGATP